MKNQNGVRADRNYRRFVQIKVVGKIDRKRWHFERRFYLKRQL